MATNPGNEFLNAYDVPTSPVAAFVVSDLRAIINNARVHNYNTLAVTLTVYMVTSGGSPNNLHTAIVKAIAPNETVVLWEILGEPMLTGASIQVKASLVSSLSLTVGGTTETE